jgi:DNA mismatch repair protein MSH6
MNDQITSTPHHQWLINEQDAHRRSRDESYTDHSTLYVPEDSYQHMTTHERFYWEVKRFNYNTVILYRLGPHFYLYEKDAEIVQQEFQLEMRLSQSLFRYCIIPYIQGRDYADKLIKLGYTVALIENGIGARPCRQSRKLEHKLESC